MIPLPTKPKLVEKKDKNRAVFEIKGLYPGYGHTIGNSLRRVLYSSLEGAAITKVKIKGAQHEFSTISGVLEDVIEVCLNLKKLRFKLHGSDPQKATLKGKGEKEVKGSDFTLPSQLELANGKEHIATLTSKSASLEIEIFVEKGIGYVPAELREKEKLSVGEISIDALFSPIKKVSFQVKDMRVGERTDFNKISIDVETDGTIEPQKALFLASEILFKHFSLIMGDISQKEDSREGSLDDTKIEDLKLSTRTFNALEKNNIKTVSGLLKKKGDDFSSIEGLGSKGIKEVKKALKKIDIEI